MCAVSSTACRKIYVGASCESEQRRDQRKAEEEKQDGAEKTPHSVIVAGFFGGCVREVSCGGESWGFSWDR
jgi:hypothetical protein